MTEKKHFEIKKKRPLFLIEQNLRGCKENNSFICSCIYEDKYIFCKVTKLIA